MRTRREYFISKDWRLAHFAVGGLRSAVDSYVSLFGRDEINNSTLTNNASTKDLEQSLSMHHIKDVLKDVSFIIDKESVTFSSLSIDLINECIKTLEKEGY